MYEIDVIKRIKEAPANPEKEKKMNTVKEVWIYNNGMMAVSNELDKLMYFLSGKFSEELINKVKEQATDQTVYNNNLKEAEQFIPPQIQLK